MVQDPKKNPKLHIPSAPEGYELRGVSTLLDADGNAQATWVKTTRSAPCAEDLRKVYEDALKHVKRAYVPAVTPKEVAKDLVCVYPLGDPHIGMLAWPKEAGKAWDLKIAVDTHAHAVGQMISHAPETEHAVLANLGDAIHADGSRSKTFAGTEVDTDGRYPKILRAAASMLIGLAESMLAKHQIVWVENVRGNHDTDVSVALAEIMRSHFRHEPRVRVRDNAALHSYKRFGQNLFWFHHGHGTKDKDLPLLMATDRPALWGKTTHRKWFCGHVHHSTVKEYPGVTVETYNTLATQDAWHAGQGYRAKQRTCCEVFHIDNGRIAKYEISI